MPPLDFDPKISIGGSDRCGTYILRSYEEILSMANNRLNSDCNSAALHCNRLDGALAAQHILLIL